MQILEVAVNVILVYLAVGVVAGAVFAFFGVARTDDATRGAGVGFRLLIIPGCAAFWPFLLFRWATANKREARPLGEAR